MFQSPVQEESRNPLCPHTEGDSLYSPAGDAWYPGTPQASQGLENQTEGAVCVSRRDSSSTIFLQGHDKTGKKLIVEKNRGRRY